MLTSIQRIQDLRHKSSIIRWEWGIRSYKVYSKLWSFRWCSFLDNLRKLLFWIFIFHKDNNEEEYEMLSAFF